MRALPHAPDVELALPHEAQAPGLPYPGAQGTAALKTLFAEGLHVFIVTLSVFSNG